MDVKTTMRILPYIVAVMQWLAGKTAGPPKHRPLATPRHLVDLVDRELAAEKRRAETAPIDPTNIRRSPEYP